MDAPLPTRPGPVPAPTALRRPHALTLHGTEVRDDFAWLKAANWREVLKDGTALPPEIRAHLEAENAYCEAVLAPTEDLQRRLVAEMRARIKEDDASVPRPDGAYLYFSRFREGGQHPMLCRRPRLAGGDEVMLDGDALAKGHDFFDFGDVAHSPDHRLLAWGSDVTGAEVYTIRVRDLATGTELEDVVTGAGGQIVWSADGSGFYYVELDENHRPARVKRHRLGTPESEDVLVYEEPEPGWFVSIEQTQSDAFVIIGVGDHETSEAWLLDRADPEARPRCIAPRKAGVKYDVEHYGEYLAILTNADGAEDFKLVTAPLAEPGRASWRDLVPHRPGILILYHGVLARHLVRLEREDARPRIVVREIATGAEHAIAFAEEAYSLSLDLGLEFDTDTIRFVYSSPATPAETYDYDMGTRGRTLLKRQEVPSGHDPASYVSGRLMARSHDGEEVPISFVRRRDTPMDGSAPLLLYGYGSYGMSIPAGFRTNILSLVDRGFVYAIAHIRGGTDKGWRWYRDGKRETKTNTFKDFVACAEAMIAVGATRAGRIVAQGGSAGGMLMGAVANMRPDLFAGIIADVPFVDVLNTMLDGDLPLTPPEWPEWGNPGIDEAAFRVILSYSPYDNVRAQAYPAILALGGLSDPRVTYWEPAKWVARLRATMTGGGPVLLRTNMEAGHGGASGRFDRLEEVALSQAFALAAVGLEGRLAA
ncbi:MAG TPA: S9 family peptidase [Salinarimonas sp.]|nr:S9 family peptidase [Salinarimonas sp.]